MKTIVPTILESSRLRLRPLVAGDADAIEEYVSDPRVAEMTALIPHPYPAGGAAEWIGRAQEAWAAGRVASFAICLRSAGRLVGVISLATGEVGIGYWIGVPYWGNGYATEALRRVLAYAFHEVGIERVETYHFAHNPASGRVMQKAGLKNLGTIPNGARRGEKVFDRVCYGASAVEWTTGSGGTESHEFLSK